MRKGKRSKGSTTLTIVFILGVGLGLGISNFEGFSEQYFSQKPEVETTVLAINGSKAELCFTPPAGCSAVIIKAISLARESIYIQAYGMSSPSIVDSLIEAHKRGVRIRILLDRSNLKQNYSKMNELISAGIEVGVDKVPGIAHNKVMIIDEKKVITGSFNFTRAADNKNAENIIIVEDAKIAEQYLQNWYSRKQKNQ